MTPDGCGWRSDLPTFAGTPPRVVRLSLADFVREAGDEQVRAWDAAIPWLQRESDSLVRCHEPAREFTAILEYELPRELRRPDVIVLENGLVAVLELKGKEVPSPADVDQVAAYARDLRCYHAECEGRTVRAVLVPTRADGSRRERDGVTIVGPSGVHALLLEFARDSTGAPLSAEAFLRPDAYAPLPTLVRAARDLFTKEELPFIKRARALTDPALRRITAIAHEAHATRTRRLVLLTGIPGSGKTLVGLQLVHAGFLDDLAVPRGAGARRPTAPAVFLSGNGPLVEVLQDALKDAGGGGKTFVRGVKEYVRHHLKRGNPVPPEHLIVFDEAQRAWTAEHVRSKHDSPDARSEPEHLVEFAERIPEWSVVVGLIGTGQEIHAGEEGGLVQWRDALATAREPGRWTVHAPADLESVFSGGPAATRWEPALSLDTAIRQHRAEGLSEFVVALLEKGDAAAAASFARQLARDDYRLWITRDLDTARSYARDLYRDAPLARYGLLASSRDKDLPAFGVDNTFQTTSRHLRVGPWYNSPPADPGSCCQLRAVATEFAAQGLELDLAVVAWGTDLLRTGAAWSIERARKGKGLKDPRRIRINAYRVLLTRARDGMVVFVPPTPVLDETAAFLEDAGFRRLE